MEIVSHIEGEWTVVSLVGRLDAATSGDLERACGTLLGEGHHRLVLEMTNLEYISSAGVRVIVAAAKRASHLGGAVAVAGPQGLVAQILKITAIDTLLPVADTVAEAIAARP